jgi:excisionase family DNA binding protein
MPLLNIVEAAQHFGVSVDTIRRRLHRGELQGQQQGRVWLIEVPEPSTGPADAQHSTADAEQGVNRLIEALQAQVQAQQEQLKSKDEQIRELHVLLQQAQAALPAPRDNRPWWRFWGKN